VTKRNNKKAMYSKTSAKRAKAISLLFKFIKESDPINEH